MKGREKEERRERRREGGKGDREGGAVLGSLS